MNNTTCKRDVRGCDGAFGKQAGSEGDAGPGSDGLNNLAAGDVCIGGVGEKGGDEEGCTGEGGCRLAAVENVVGEEGRDS